METQLFTEIIKAGPFGISLLLFGLLTVLWKQYGVEREASRKYQEQVVQLSTVLEKLVQSHESLGDAMERLRMDTHESRRELQGHLASMSMTLAGLQARQESHPKRPS